MNKDNIILNKLIIPQRLGRAKPKLPIVRKFQKAKQEIIFIGVEHSVDPKNQQFALIEDLFMEFMQLHPRKKIAVAIEGSIPPVIKSRATMIRQYRETGLLVYLARKHNIQVFCPEPKAEEMTAYVLGKRIFKKEDIGLWAFLNIALTLIKRGKHHRITPEVLREISTIFERAARSFCLKNPFLAFYLPYFSTRVRNIKAGIILPSSEKELVGMKVALRKYEKLQNPFIKKTVLNDISAAFNYARDGYIAANILRELKEGKSVFAVFSWNHAVAQRPVFKEFFKKKEPITRMDRRYSVKARKKTGISREMPVVFRRHHQRRCGDD